MDCDGCERRVRNAVAKMKGKKRAENPFELAIEEAETEILILIMILFLFLLGVKTVEVNRKQSKVTVTGFVEANRVLKKVRRTGKRAELWPYVPVNVVAYPYVAQAYDKRAPAGFVKNAVQALPSPNAVDEKLTTMFSDDNPNGCSVM